MQSSTDIINLAHEARNELLKKDKKKSEAEIAYANSLKEISEISGTPWYISIKKYWEKEFKIALRDLWLVNAIDNPWITTKLQERIDLSSRFLYYLSIYEKNW